MDESHKEGTAGHLSQLSHTTDMDLAEELALLRRQGHVKEQEKENRFLEGASTFSADSLHPAEGIRSTACDKGQPGPTQRPGEPEYE